MTTNLDPNAVERAVEMVRDAVRASEIYGQQLTAVGNEHAKLVCLAATRAAELESENEVLREQNIELNDGCVALERERDAACEVARLRTENERLRGEVERAKREGAKETISRCGAGCYYAGTTYAASLWAPRRSGGEENRG